MALFCLASNELIELSSDENTFLTKRKFNPQNTVIALSSVVENNNDLTLFDKDGPQYKKFLIADFLKTKHFLDMPIHYSSRPGQDRIIAAYYAFKRQLPAIVIDTGSFTTVDYIDENGFQGGSILPGLDLIKNCYSNGDGLASLERLLSRDHLASWKPNAPKQPNDSLQAVVNGIMTSFLRPIEQLINNEKAQSIYLTGGNAALLNSFLKPQNPRLHLNPNLIHYALVEFVQAVERKR